MTVARRGLALITGGGVGGHGMIRINAPFLGDEEKAAVLRVLERGRLSQGPETAHLEAEWAALVGTRHAVATSSGTAALHLALLAHGIGPGDEVITTAFTFVATVNAILYVGALPVFADVDSATFNLDPRTVEPLITPRTRAILPVHLYGCPADMAAIQALAQTHGLVVVEDAAQAIGANIDGRMVGSFGTGAFSLYATKNVTSGEGGMVTTDSDEIADRVRLLRSHGARTRYEHERLGYNFRLSELHAAIGRVQLGRQGVLAQARAYNAAQLSAYLRRVSLPTVPAGYQHVWHQYTVQVPPEVGRDALAAKLAAAEIEVGVYYRTPAHRIPYVREAAGDYRLPITEALAERVLSLPVHPGLSPTDLDQIVGAVNDNCTETTRC
jgi:perosamine synthetase